MWFYYALFSALFSGFSVVLNKRALRQINSSLMMWALSAFSLPFLFYPAFRDGLPVLNQSFLFAIIISVLSFTLAKTISLKAIKGSLLSEIIPLTFFSVFFNYFFALVFLGENINLLHFTGLVLIVAGGYWLKVKEAKENLLEPFKILFRSRSSQIFMLAMMIFPISAIADKSAIQSLNPANPYFILFLENLLIMILVSGYMTKNDRNWISDLKKNFFQLLVNGVVYIFVSLFFLLAITNGNVALVSGVKKTEVLLVLLFSWLAFADKPKKEVVFGSLLMLGGVILLKLT